MKKIVLLIGLVFFSQSLFAEEFKIVCDDFKRYENKHTLHTVSRSSVSLSDESDFYINLKNNTIKEPDIRYFEQTQDSEGDSVIVKSPPYKIIQNKDGILLAVHLVEELSSRLRWYYLDLVNLSMMTGTTLSDDENTIIKYFEEGFVGEHYWSRDCVDEGQKLATKLGVKSLSFTINEQNINPNIIECLYTYEACFNTGPNYKTKEMEYQVHFPMKRLRYTNPSNSENRGYNFRGYKIGKDYSYWLIETKIEVDELKRASMIVEVYDPKENSQSAHVRAVKIIPFNSVDVKYGHDYYLEDKNKDGIEELVFLQQTGGSGIQSDIEDIHFLDWDSTENHKVEVKTVNTHNIIFAPNLDNEIMVILEKNKPDITFKNTTTREAVYLRGTKEFWLVEKNLAEFTANNYDYKTLTIYNDVVENFAKNNKANYKRKKNNATIFVVEY